MALFTSSQLAVLPLNISNAQLDVAVSDASSGAVVIRVDALVAWTVPRPRAEFVPAEDRVVILTVTHVDGAKRWPGKRVVATRADLVQPIVRSFNQLRVSAPQYSYECPPGALLLLSNRLCAIAELETRSRRRDQSLRWCRSDRRQA